MNFAKMFVAIAMFAGSVAFAGTEVHDAMEDVIGPAFKVLSTDLRAGKIEDLTNEAANLLVMGFEAIQGFYPDEIPLEDGTNRAFEEDDKQPFDELNSQMLALAKDLAREVGNHDVTAAQAVMKDIVELRKDAHSRFKKHEAP